MKRDNCEEALSAQKLKEVGSVDEQYSSDKIQQRLKKVFVN